jgi:hypothetical protein
MKKTMCLVLVGLAGACSNAQQLGGKVSDTSNTFQTTATEGRKMWHSVTDAWDDLVNGKPEANSTSQVAGGGTNTPSSNTSNSSSKQSKKSSQPAQSASDDPSSSQ